MRLRENETSHLDDPEGDARPRRPGLPVDRQRVFRAIHRARHGLIAAVLVGGVLGVVAGPLLFPPTYTSSTTIRFDGLPAMPGLAPPSYAAVQAYADGLYAEPVLMEVRRELGDQLPGSLDAIRSRITMTSDPQSGAIRAEVSAATPEAARKFGEVLGRAFLEYQTEQLRARLDDAHRKLDEQLSMARLAHSRARKAWDSFRAEHGVDSVEAEQGRIESAAGLRAEATLAANEVSSLEDRVATLKREIERIPKLTVSQHQESSPEASRLAEAEAALAEKSTRLTPVHPEVEALRRQVRLLRLRLHEGRSSSVTTQTYGPNADRSTLAVSLAEAESALAAARGRAAGLRRHADDAEAKVAAFGALEGEALALRADLEIQRDLEQRLESERARVAGAVLEPESGFAITKPAHVPQAPEPNKMRALWTMIAPILALLAGAIAVVARELRGLRVCTPNELAYWADAPVIGATTWPNEPGCLDELVEGLDDFAPMARGEYLLVGASAWDAALAETIAARLSSDLDPDAARLSEGEGGEELALRPGSALERRGLRPMRVASWGGESKGPSLRRAARLADRVLVVVSSGALSVVDVLGLKRRLGRERGLGFVMVNVPMRFQGGPDRVGPVSEFWALDR